MDIILILAVALLIEFIIGDPPDRVHPVAWLGRLISFFERFGLSGGKYYQFFYGVLLTLLLAAGVAVTTWFIVEWLKDFNFILYIIFTGILLKASFSFVYLRKTALKIKKLIESDKTIDQGRFELRSLVSRDTTSLSRPYLVSATVESVSESLCDSLISPLFFFLLFGLPGAFFFRIVSTFDSMVGYRGKYEYLGKFPAYLDDVLNFIPARISVLVIVIAAYFTERKLKRAWSIAMEDHKKTESPNAGWPMAAAAGALGVQFEKIGYYRLGSPDRPMVPSVIDDSLRLINGATLVWFIICFVAGGIIFAIA
mgnify:CR=1 FL=1